MNTNDLKHMKAAGECDSSGKLDWVMLSLHATFLGAKRDCSEPMVVSAASCKCRESAANSRTMLPCACAANPGRERSAHALEIPKPFEHISLEGTYMLREDVCDHVRNGLSTLPVTISTCEFTKIAASHHCVR